MKYQITCQLSGCIIRPEEILAIESINLPTDNWYAEEEANSNHRNYRCGFGLFALLKTSKGNIWYPIEKEQVKA
tara:strand:+ start:7067 stop:7288 length:222 start_codon:yes stop_codon:yes gene_type:complete